jgi:hypothetical protein
VSWKRESGKAGKRKRERERERELAKTCTPSFSFVLCLLFLSLRRADLRSSSEMLHPFCCSLYRPSANLPTYHVEDLTETLEMGADGGCVIRKAFGEREERVREKERTSESHAKSSPTTMDERKEKG